MKRRAEIGIATIVVLILALIALAIIGYFGNKTISEGKNLDTCAAMGGMYVPADKCN